MYGNGFHHRNGGFLKNGFVVSHPRTAGTWRPDYSGRKDMFQVLWPFIDYAIANAERLDKLNERKTPASAVPGTKVHELIKHLRL